MIACLLWLALTAPMLADAGEFLARVVAMTEQHYAMGQFIGTTTLDSVEFPAVLPAPTFNPAAVELTARATGAPRAEAGGG